MPPVTDQDAMYQYAVSFLGLPYKWGSRCPVDGIDCSGLVLNLLEAFGALASGENGTAQTLYHRFQNVCRPQFGALAFYGTSIEGVSHVGFLLTETTMLEAGGGGPKILTREDAARANACVRIRPYMHRKDLIAVRLPLYPWNKV